MKSKLGSMYTNLDQPDINNFATWYENADDKKIKEWEEEKNGE